MHVALPYRDFPCLVPVNIRSKNQAWFFVSEFLGGHSEGDPPVPIPNTAVKPLSPDGTARASVWESRKLPGLIPKAPPFLSGGFIFVHCCPARSRIESIGCWHRVNRRWSRRPEGPVKWAFSRIASRSRSVEFGRGWRPARDASGRWRRGHKRTRRSRFASSLRSRWSRRML